MATTNQLCNKTHDQATCEASKMPIKQNNYTVSVANLTFFPLPPLPFFPFFAFALMLSSGPSLYCYDTNPL